MIKKYWFFLSIAFLTISCGSLKNASDQGITYDKLDNALLWKITGQDAQESYLFGTIHIIDAESFFYPEGLLSALETCDKIMFEIDMNDMNDMGAQMELMQKATMKGDQSLSDLISEEDYELVKAHFEKMGLPLFMFERLKPMFLTVFAGDMDPKGLQTGTMKSYEMELVKIGNDKKMETGGLETIDYQLSVFDSIPYVEQAQMLVDAIKMGSSDSDYLDEMIGVYVKQDLNRMVEMFTEEDSDIEGYEDVLLINRNKNWIPLMESEMKVQSCFFAVGAGHLGGKDGVIHLLRQQGYSLTPVNPVE